MSQPAEGFRQWSADGRSHVRPRIVIIGVGDAPNDVALLREVEIPIIVRNGNAQQTEHLIAELPHARVSRGWGASGWNEAIEDVVGAMF